MEIPEIYEAIRSNDLETVKRIVAAGFDVNDQEESGTMTPLALAAAKNDFAIVKFLLEKGADPNQPTGMGVPITSLLLPSQKEMRSFLIEKGSK